MSGITKLSIRAKKSDTHGIFTIKDYTGLVLNPETTKQEELLNDFDSRIKSLTSSKFNASKYDFIDVVGINSKREELLLGRYVVDKQSVSFMNPIYRKGILAFSDCSDILSDVIKQPEGVLDFFSFLLEKKLSVQLKCQDRGGKRVYSGLGIYDNDYANPYKPSEGYKLYETSEGVIDMVLKYLKGSNAKASLAQYDDSRLPLSSPEDVHTVSLDIVTSDFEGVDPLKAIQHTQMFYKDFTMGTTGIETEIYLTNSLYIKEVNPFNLGSQVR